MSAARTRFSAISATTSMQKSVSGQCESVNESRRVGDRAGGPAG
jgi:hypothetical protein